MVTSNNPNGEKNELQQQVQKLRDFVPFNCTEEDWEQREKLIIEALTSTQLGLYR